MLGRSSARNRGSLTSSEERTEPGGWTERSGGLLKQEARQAWLLYPAALSYRGLMATFPCIGACFGC
jgi:hypothetical protein